MLTRAARVKWQWSRCRPDRQAVPQRWGGRVPRSGGNEGVVV